MITSSNNISLNSAQQKDKFVIVGGKENLVVDSRGYAYPMGGIAPDSAPTAEVITGGGALTPNIGYAYAYSYLNTYQDCETYPSPASAYVGRKDQGSFKTIRFSDDGLVIYVSGVDLEKSADYYIGQTLACKIVNDEYVNIYSQWQYRSITAYSYNPAEQLGEFRINRPFFNVDPDPADREYEVKIEDLDTESGIVGGQSKGKDKLVLDASASQTPSDYRFKTIHITQGKGKGQKRIIMDATQREDGLIEITVDSPWKEKPKWVDDSKKDIYYLREQAEKQKGTKRPKNFYKKYYSSEYVISDPLRYNGLAIDCNVISYDDKGRRVKLSGLGHSGDLLTGTVVSYQDAKASEMDKVTIILDGESDMSSADEASYINKRFRIYDGVGAGLDTRIVGVVKASENRITLKIDMYGKMKKKAIPNATSKFVIYGGETLSSCYIAEKTVQGQTTRDSVFPRVFGSEVVEDGIVDLICCGNSGYIDSAYLCASEADNVETYNNTRCYVMFKVKDKHKREYYISRPIISARNEEITEEDKNTNHQTRTYQRLYLRVSDLPKVDGEVVKIAAPNNGKYPAVDLDNEYAYYVFSDNLQDGYYTGWIAAFYNTQDTFAKGKKKVRTSRVAGYLDATGELLLCNGVAGVGEGWQCVLYSEYTKQIGSRVKVYAEDSYNPSYTSQTNTRFFCLDYFASPNDDEYKDWQFEFLYGTAKKVKGRTIYQQDKNKKTYTVFAYDGDKRRVDCAGDDNYAKGVRMKPAPTGNEFVTLYDPSTYIFKVFNSNDDEDDDTNGQGEGNNQSQDGIKMKVSGIVRTSLQGFDKIKLYRASESTETYRLCAVLENKTQTYIDNAEESELTTEINYTHSAPNPVKYIAERNARFALAGVSVDEFNAFALKDSFIVCEDYTTNPIPRKNISYNTKNYMGSTIATSPLLGVKTSEIAWVEANMLTEGMSDNLVFHLVIGKPAVGAEGVIGFVEKRLSQSMLDNRIYDTEEPAPAEGDTSVFSVSEFYLNPEEKGKFTNGTLRIVDANGDTLYLKFGEDITYDTATRKITLTSGTIDLKFKYANLGVEYKDDGTSETKYAWIYEPAVYSIYSTAFSIYYKGGEPYSFDGVNETQLTATEIAGGSALYFAVDVPAMASDSNLKITFGGDINSRVNGDTLPTDLYYFAMSRKETDDSPLVSYMMSELTFTQEWDWQIKKEDCDTKTTSPFGSISCLETDGRPCQLYVKHDDADGGTGEPLIPAKELRCFISGYYFIALDKPYRQESGDVKFFLKDGGIELQITTAGAGLREKVELADVYNFNDGIGTKIMGVIAVRMGFVVFKDRGIYILDPDKRHFQIISKEFGCIAPSSIAEGRGGVFWLSNGGRVEYQDFDDGTVVRDIGAGLRPWFDGDVTIDGHSVDWNRIESDTFSVFDSDYGDYILAIPCKKTISETVTNTTVILVFNEVFAQWWRIDDTQSKNSVKHAFQYEGRAAFCGTMGIYDFKPDKSVINPWKYESRWRDEGTNDTEKVVKRMKFNNFVDTSRTDQPQGEVLIYKDQKTSPEPNFTAWTSVNSHPFYTNQAKSQIECGARCYEWKFIMSGNSYIKMKGIDVVVRKKEDVEPMLGNAPQIASNNNE